MESKIWHKRTYPLNRNRLTDRENRALVAKGGGEGTIGVSVVSGCKLLHIEWVKNKILLYGTGKYVRYPGINHNGRECYINNIKIF